MAESNKPWLKANIKLPNDLPIFPCNPKNKAPLTPHGFKDASSDSAIIKAWWQRHPQALIGMPTGQLSKRVVIDLDRKPGQADGVVEWPKFLAENGAVEIETHLTETPSTGQHLTFIFDQPLGGLPLGRLWPGIEVKADGGYVIIAPSKGYKRLNDLAPVPAPQWLIDRIKELRTVREQPSFSGDEDGTASPEELALAMAAIPNESPAWEDWNRVAMALWRASGGQAFELFDEWSKKWPGYNARHTRDRWRAISRSKPTELGTGTLFYLAQEADPYWREGGYSEEAALEGARLAAQLISPRPAPPLAPPPESPTPGHLLAVPGLVGEIAQFVADSALYPQPLMALAAGLTIVGTAAGRRILGPTKSGTVLYIICLAGTGVGKDHPRSMIIEIMKAAGMASHNGPEQFMSMPALVNFLKRQPLSLCAQDEFGSYLKRMNSKRASSFEATLMATMQKAWSSTASTLLTPEWAQVPSETIIAPSMSLVGFSTPDQFFEALQSKDVANGFLNRCLVFETLHRPKQQKPKTDWMKIPAPIIKRLKAIYSQRDGALSLMSGTTPRFVHLDISPEAEALRVGFVEELSEVGDEFTHNLMARAPEIAVRLATIVAIGLGQDCIDVDEMRWGIEFSRWAGMRLVALAKEHVADSEHQIMAKEVLRTIKRLAAKSGQVKQADVHQAIRHKYNSRDLEDVFKGLRLSGDVVVTKQEKPKGGGPVTLWYALGPGC